MIIHFGYYLCIKRYLYIMLYKYYGGGLNKLTVAILIECPGP